ncbi:MAG: ATP-dependent Clp protease adapter ClpS [Legionellaceae bacterium]|nr:ATP-dependent Clp protease adapter ClpS [Legionellaceae bacterium]HCA89840.1 ATP-dependent Clp protease adapter ClpS [Legionellales bacterium]|tara:strand:- start:3396 stop:3719 length:324 start_codon:yes stop_codon:yes gene_type:complete
MDDFPLHDHVTLKKIISANHARVSQPQKYKVILLNDDYTSMEFVIWVLKRFFNLSEAKAIEVMYQVHTKGKGVAGIYTRDIAETKSTQVNHYAREHDYPLLCTIQPV